MLFDYETLKFIWWVLIGALLIGFAITDGMDIGAAILLPFVAKKDVERRVVINTVGAHWDGNQVWLITAGGALFAAWPMVYAAAFSGFYFAMMLVLFALFFRPLAFDYRSKIESAKWRNNWDWALFCGSAIPALVFGVAFGNLVQGVPIHFDELMRIHYDGGFFALLNPMAILFGVVSVTMLIAHGGIWLQLRTTDEVASRSAKAARVALMICLVCFALAGVWVANIDGLKIVTMASTQSHADPLAKTVVAESGAWLNNYQLYPVTLVFPILAFVTGLGALLFSIKQKAGLGFTFTSLMMLSIIMTFGCALFPFVMPSSYNPSMSLTIWDAVSSHLTLNIMFIVVVLLLPVVLGYTLWCYSKMWRKVTNEEITNNTHGSY